MLSSAAQTSIACVAGKTEMGIRINESGFMAYLGSV
jgi:hypothetical protein